jgi:hypothetical protein
MEKTGYIGTKPGTAQEKTR